MVQAKTVKRRHEGSGFKRLPKGPNGGIELLLIQTVDKLGKQGDVVEVRAGYANNYLLPQGLATILTEHHKRMVANHISNLSATIEANANDEGHLYGSVGAIEIIGELKKHDVHLLPDQIRLEGVLKELGLYTVKVKLHKDVETDLKVWVVPSVAEEDQ